MKKSFLAGIAVTLILSSAAWAKIGGGDITFKVKEAGNVVYTHDSHVVKLGLKCAECHYHIFNRMANNYKDKATMFDMMNGKSCGVCHNGRKAFGVEKNCIRCHQNKTISLL